MSAHAPLRGAVLAAGLGTRLRPLTAALPKPLVPMLGEPLIYRALKALRKLGVGPIGVNAHHAGRLLHEALNPSPGALQIVDEPELLGTGGGIRGIESALGGTGTLVVINGDALFDFDLAPALAQHRASGAEATLVLRPAAADDPFARVGVDHSGRVRRISEVEGPGAHEGTRLGAYTGVQFVERSVLDVVPEGPCDIFRSAYRTRLDAHGHIGAHFVDPKITWIDVGTVERYLDAHQALLGGRLATDLLPAPIRPGVYVHPSAKIHPTAQLTGPCAVGAGAVVGAHAVLGEGVFVGSGARVAAETRLRRVVFWAGADGRGTLENTVVMGAQPTLGSE